jgi:uncharacterized integral membrane protein
MELKQIAAAVLALIVLILMLWFVITKSTDARTAFFAWLDQIKASLGIGG